MPPYTEAKLPVEIKSAIERHILDYRLKKAPRIFHDTTDSMNIDYGDVIVLEDRYFLVTGYEKEGRFGIDDEPKFWVKRVKDLQTGEARILKLVFYETFVISVGQLKVTCYRNPAKEARVLELVKGHERFMQGRNALDEAGNLIRILEIIRGKRLDKYIDQTPQDHQEYFYKETPALLRQFLECAKAIDFLHQNGFKHGDIRRDHIYVEASTGLHKWIDFDYDFYLPERPFALDMFGLGNILLFIIGRSNYRPLDVYEHPKLGQSVLDKLTTDDLSLLFKDRIVNLKKLFPYIPDALNNILMHFSASTPVFYDRVEELTTDIEKYLNTLD